MKKKGFILGALFAAAMFTMPMMAAETAEETPVATEDAQILQCGDSVNKVDFVSDVVYTNVYKGGKNNPLKMDLLLPASEEPVPVLVFIKGSGFTKQYMDGWLQPRLRLAEAGYAVVSVEYRTVPIATFPAPILDTKTAIRYLRAHAEMYNIDPERIGIWGDSSGGWVATMVGASNGVEEFDQGEYLDYSSDVDYCIDWYGVTDLTTIGHGYDPETEEGHLSPATTEALLLNGTAFPPNKGAAVNADQELADSASPMTYVDAEDPAFLIFHGTADPLVSIFESDKLYESLKEAGVEASLYHVEGAGHGDNNFSQPEITDIMIEFMNAHS